MVPFGISIDTDRYHLAVVKSNFRKAGAERRSQEEHIMAHRNALTIDDLLADPLIQKVMRADRVEPEPLKVLLQGTARRIADARRTGSVQVGEDLGRRIGPRAPLMLMRPATRATAHECEAAICG